MNRQKMEEGHIFRLLVELSVPAIIGMLVNAIYNIVDRIFIGQQPELGKNGLAGIAIVFPVMLVMMALSLMIGVGGATRFSIAFGAKRTEDAAYYQGNSLVMITLSGLCITAVGLIFIDPILRVLGASDAIMPYAESYLSIVLYGAVFQCIAICGNNFSRAQGNAKNAMISQLIGAGFNIVFDYILIVRMGMGMRGAAWATVGGQFLASIWQLAYLFGRRPIIRMAHRHLLLRADVMRSVLMAGIPVFLMQMSASVVNLVINRSLKAYGGDLAISVAGVLTSVQTLFLMPLLGLAQGQQPIVGYNFGAGRPDRVKATVRHTVTISTVVSILSWLAIEFFPEAIFRQFNDDPELVEMGKTAMRIWFFAMPLIGSQIMMANFFQAIGKVRLSGILGLLRQTILLLPLILLLGSMMKLRGIYFAFPVADVLSFFVTIGAFFYTMRRLGEDVPSAKARAQR